MDLSPLRRAVEMGNAFACLSWQVWMKTRRKLFPWLNTAHHDRDGFFLLGRCLC